MNRNWIGIICLLSLCIGLSAEQLPLKSWIETRGVIEADTPFAPPMEIQAAGEKSLFLITETYSFDENSDPLGGFIKINNTGEVYFAADLMALANQKVRFTFFWIGPEILSYTSDWYTLKKKEWNYVTAGGARNLWSKGVYKMIVCAESNKSQSGSTMVAECTVWFY